MSSIWGLDESVCYCPEHNELTTGMFKEHYCSGSFYLGQLRESYIQMLEVEIETLEVLVDYYRYREKSDD